MRETIFETLKHSETANLNKALDACFKSSELKSEEKAYITNISHQLYRYKLRFDALIRLYCHKEDGLTDNARIIMLIALCEMYCMQSIPVHASVNEAVNLAKKFAKNEVALINAVLRKTDKEFPFKEIDKDKFLKEIKFLYPKKTKLELLACYESLPGFLLDIMRKQYSQEFATHSLNTLNEIPWYSYRFNALKADWEQNRNELLNTSIFSKTFAYTGYATQNPQKKAQEFQKDGILSAQGASSQIAVARIIEKIGKENLNNIWDMCCGVGGKSLALAEQGVQIGLATDTSEQRLAVLHKECARLGVEPIKTENISALDANINNVSAILLDAPCSGTGTLCSNPDIRYRITKKSIQEKTELQNALLRTAYEKLTNNGYICYITCSIHKAENEWLIDEFCKENSIQCIHSEYIFPEVCGADTLFLAILQKKAV